MRGFSRRLHYRRTPAFIQTGGSLTGAKGLQKAQEQEAIVTATLCSSNCTVYHICMDIHIHTDMRMSNAIQIRKMYNLDILRIVLQSRQVQFARRVS